MIDLASTPVAPDAGDRPRPSWPSVAVFAIGLLASLTAGWLLHAREVRQQEANLQTDVAIEAQVLEERLRLLVTDVQAVAQLHDAFETVTAAEFGRFVQPFLERHSGLLALGWIPRVTAERRADFEATARAEGLADFVIRDWSEDAAPVRPTPPRPEYFPVLRLATLNHALEHARALGLDVGAEPLRRATLERAAATGQPAVSPPLRLVQAPQGPPALIVFAPLPAESSPVPRGFAVGLVRLGTVLKEVVAGLPTQDLDRVLHAAEPAGAAGLLAILPSRRHPPGTHLDPDALDQDPREVEARLTVADRTLILRDVPPPGAWPSSTLPKSLTGLGILLSLILALGLHHRRRGLQRLQESEARLRLLIEHAPAALAMFDRAMRYIGVSQRWCADYGLGETELIGRSHYDIFPEIGAEWRAVHRRALAGESVSSPAERFVRADGEAQWIRWAVCPWRDATGAVAGIGIFTEEVTALKVAEQALRDERAHLEERVAERTAALQRSEARLRTIFDLLPVGISITDPRGHIIDSNQAAETILGLARETHLARDFDGPEWRILRPDGSLMPPEEYAGVRALTERRLVRDVEMGVVTPAGKVRWILVSAMPAPHLDYGVVIVYVDITARREAELRQQADELALRRERQRLQYVIDGTRAGTWEWDVPTGETRFNERWAEIVGYRLKELEPVSIQTWLMLAHPQDLKEVQTRLDAHFTSQNPYYECESRMRHKDGHWVWVIDRGSVMTWTADGRPALMCGTHQDITALKQAQEAIEQAARARSAFLAQMSHEIRNPMNAIVGLSELALRRRRSRPLDPVTRDDLENLHRSARNLLGILNDILDQSKIEAGRLTLDPAPFAVAALLEDLRTLFAATAAERGLTLTLAADPDLPLWLVGDVLRLRQVLSNLLSNALKFTERGTVALRIASLDGGTKAARLRWTVEDTGLGMDEATQARLFKPFSQGDDSITRRFGGTGLGLSISRTLVELMGGQIHLESTPGAGSRFWFELTLPVAAAAPGSAPGSAPAPIVDLTGARILVAEDQPLNRRIIAEMLQLLGVTATLAEDGQAALDRLAASPAAFDAVLLDIQMPVLDGLSTAQRLRADPRWAALPVIALTGGVTPEERQRIQAVGMNDLIAKPVTLDVLSATLGRWLAGRARPIVPVAEPAAMTPLAGTDAPQAALVLPGFALDALFMLRDRLDIVDLLWQFAQSIGNLPDALADALAAGRFDQARADAHRLKGMAANVGAVALAAATERLEETLRDDRHDPERLAALRQAHAEALAAIATLDSPAAAPPPTTPDIATSVSPDADAPWVLLVDDEPVNLAFLAGALREGCQLLTASRGADALTLARGEPRPELILLDVQLPDLDGYAVCQQLQADPRTAAIPVIFVTARDRPEDQARGFALGGLDYIVKPCLPEIVRARVTTHLRLRRQAEQLDRQAHLDPLTGLANRRRLMATLDLEWRRAARDGQPLSALMIDIDHFKGYNDQYGHGAGDTCLCRVATALAQTLLRPGDLLARYGGEEFVALLPDTDPDAARLLAERLRAAVLALALPHAASSAGTRVSVSIGGATFQPGQGETDGERLLASADRQLYLAKAAGRNRSLVDA